MPVPEMLRGSAVARLIPFKSKTAPEFTTVLLVTVPSGEFAPDPAAPSFSVPYATVVRPLYELVPDSITTPLKVSAEGEVIVVIVGEPICKPA